jgi:dienelactone hydrolase
LSLIDLAGSERAAKTGNRGLRMIEGATHGFDWPNPPPPAFSQFAKAQTGGVVTMRYSPKDAVETRQEMVEFFSNQLVQK